MIIKDWLKFITLCQKSRYIFFSFRFLFRQQQKTLPIWKLEFLNFTSAFGESTRTVKTTTKCVIGHLQLRKKAEKSSEKTHRLMVCLIEGCLKVTINVGEHFHNKMHKLTPGPDYYQLLQSAKIYVSMTQGLIEVSP